MSAAPWEAASTGEAAAEGAGFLAARLDGAGDEVFFGLSAEDCPGVIGLFQVQPAFNVEPIPQTAGRKPSPFCASLNDCTKKGLQFVSRV